MKRLNIVLLFMLSLLLTGCSISESWNLMTCKGQLMDDGGCFENGYILEGYKNQRECMAAGIDIASKTGFECGKNCKPSKDYGGIVCEEICNSSGCH